MKKRILAWLSAALFLLLAGCGEPTDFAGHVDAWNEKMRKEYLEKAPDPADFPADFSIRYESWIDESRKNIIDTAEGYVQVDLVQGGTAEGHFEPDEELLRSIWEMVVRTDLTSLTRLTSSTFSTDGTTTSVSPATYYRITVTMNGERRTVNADSSVGAYASYYSREIAKDGRFHPQAWRFCEFVRFMNGLDTGAFDTPPVPVGGYL